MPCEVGVKELTAHASRLDALTGRLKNAVEGLRLTADNVRSTANEYCDTDENNAESCSALQRWDTTT